MTKQRHAGVTRRSMLKWTGLGVGSAVVVVGVGAGVRGGSNGAFDAGSGDPYELWKLWPGMTGTDRIVAAGILACNPHNTQPWLIGVEGDVLTVSSDASREMPINDANSREHFAGLGCAIESMVIAAKAAGSAVDVQLFPEGDASDTVAHLTLGQGSASGSDEELANAIPLRHTNRGPFAPEALSSRELKALDVGTPDLAGTSVTWITDINARAKLGQLYVEATEAIAADREQSEESFSWFRSDRSDVDRHRDGLTLDGQGLDGLTLFLAKVLPAESRADGDAFWVKTTRDVHTATAAAYGVITVADVADRTNQVVGGRLLGRLHLAATAAGLGFHHMNQITERIDRDAATGATDVFAERWSAILDAPASSGLLSFRIGKPQRSPGLSPRRPVSDVVHS